MSQHCTMQLACHVKPARKEQLPASATPGDGWYLALPTRTRGLLKGASKGTRGKAGKVTSYRQGS